MGKIILHFASVVKDSWLEHLVHLVGPQARLIAAVNLPNRCVVLPASLGLRRRLLLLVLLSHQAVRGSTWIYGDG